MKETDFKFWYWFFKGSGGKSGIKRLFLDWWIFILIAIGIGLSFFAPLCLDQAASAILLPLIGILIGLSFAWSGNAQVLLQSKHIIALGDKHPGGYTEYVYIYQTAILAILVSLVLWTFAGLGIFDNFWPTPHRVVIYFFTKVLLYTWAGLTLRECWSVMLFTNWLLIANKTIESEGKNN
jgi:hypothetical protein